MLGGLVQREGDLQPDGRGRQRAGGHVDGQLQGGVGHHRVEQRLAHLGVDLDRDQSVLGAVVAEDVGEAGGDHGLEAVVHDRPHRVLARRAGAEVRAGHQDGGPLVLLLVEHEVAVVAPLREQPGAEAGALHPLEPVAGDDLVGVDVGAFERHGRARDHDDGFHWKILSVARRRSGGQAGRRGWRRCRRRRWPRPPPATPGGCARRGPVGPRSCGCWWRPPARRGPACRGSWPGTSSSRAHATRSRRPPGSGRDPRLRPGPSPGTNRARPWPASRRARCGRGPPRPRPGGPRCGRWCTSR